MESPHLLTNDFRQKKAITSAYSKNSNSSGFKPILQEFYEMICEVIVSKTVCGIFSFFCQSSFINNFKKKSNFSEPWNHRKLNISRPIYFKNISAHCFEDPIYTNKLDRFFFRKTFFSRTWSFFHDWKTINLGGGFFPQKNNFILFFKSDYLILIYY